jgi:hypothetical protein
MFEFLRNLIAGLFGRQTAPAPTLGRLAELRKGEFFSWFNLVDRVAPVGERDGRARHSFHPSGEAFQSFVRLDLVVTDDDAITAALLALDRDFVEDERNGAFARDITKSFLAVALRNDQNDTTRALISDIASFASVKPPVITRVPSEPLSADPSGCYAVYLGQRVAAELALVHTRLMLRNTANGRRWLIIEVTAL